MRSTGRCFLSLFCFSGILLGLGAVAAPKMPPCMVRDLDDKKQLRCTPISPLNFSSKTWEAYIFEDLRDKSGYRPPVSMAKLRAMFEMLDKDIYPRFNEQYAVDPKKDLRIEGESEDKLVVIFDNLSDRGLAGHFDKRFVAFYQRDIMVIDVTLDLFKAKYHLVHELQHLIRYLYNNNEEHWLTEGLSRFVENDYYKTFPDEGLGEFPSFPTRSLNIETRDPAEYYNLYVFFYYLSQHYGGQSLIRDLITSQEQQGIANIETRLKERMAFESRDFKRKTYSFQSVFVNYQIALLVSTHSSLIDSEGTLDLMFPKPATHWQHQPEALLKNMLYSLSTLSSRFFRLLSPCVSFQTVDSRSFEGVGIFVDLSREDKTGMASEEEKPISVLNPGHTACVKERQSWGQYLIVTNLSPTTEVSVEILASSLKTKTQRKKR